MCAAEQVLDHFRARFIKDVDANAIVLELKHKNIIADGDEREVSQKHDKTQQNQILQDRLRQKCTNKALMTVCEVLTDVRGNPKMSALGADMKSMLEGKCCVCVTCCVCTTEPNDLHQIPTTHVHCWTAPYESGVRNSLICPCYMITSFCTGHTKREAHPPPSGGVSGKCMCSELAATVCEVVHMSVSEQASRVGTRLQ